MRDRIAIKRVPVFLEDMALYSIREHDIELLEHHLSKDPLLGKPVSGETGIRELDFAGHRVVYHPVENYGLIVLLQIRPRQAGEPKMSKPAKTYAREAAKLIAKEGLKKWRGL